MAPQVVFQSRHHLRPAGFNQLADIRRNGRARHHKSVRGEFGTELFEKLGNTRRGHGIVRQDTRIDNHVNALRLAAGQFCPQPGQLAFEQRPAFDILELEPDADRPADFP
ncbi:hypothetical protein D9M72_563160 [compost metagenome]